jgi:roadblock/LC7 domain-containing protein
MSVITQADLDALDRMIASGITSMSYDGKRLEYRSLAELRQARATLAAQIAATSDVGRTAFINPTFDRGL